MPFADPAVDAPSLTASTSFVLAALLPILLIFVVEFFERERARWEFVTTNRRTLMVTMTVTYLGAIFAIATGIGLTFGYMLFLVGYAIGSWGVIVPAGIAVGVVVLISIMRTVTTVQDLWVYPQVEPTEAPSPIPIDSKPLRTVSVLIPAAIGGAALVAIGFLLGAGKSR